MLWSQLWHKPVPPASTRRRCLLPSPKGIYLEQKQPLQGLWGQVTMQPCPSLGPQGQALHLPRCCGGWGGNRCTAAAAGCTQGTGRPGRPAFVLKVTPEIRGDMGFIDLLSKQGEAKLISHHLRAANTQVEARVGRPMAILQPRGYSGLDK